MRQRRLDHYHELERAHIHLVLLGDALAGLDDVRAGRTSPISELRKKFGR